MSKDWKKHNHRNKAPYRVRIRPNRDDPLLCIDDLDTTRTGAITVVDQAFIEHGLQDGGTGAAAAVVSVVWHSLSPVSVSVIANHVPGAFLIRNRVTRRTVADVLGTLCTGA